MKYKNKIKCKKCSDIIESKHRHDFVRCSCDSVFVDGGHEYQRLGWPGGDIDDWVETIKEPIEEG